MRIANTPDSTSNSEGDRFCRLNHKRRGRRRGLFDVNEPAGTNRRADANGSRSLQSRNHTHYVAGSVVETNIHYPTDSDLLGDGARVLTRTMQKVEKAAGGLKKRIRNRMRRDCASSGGSVGGNAASSSPPTSTAETIPGNSRNDGRACATGGTANQGASVSRDNQVSA